MKKREGIAMVKIRTLFYCLKQGFRGAWKNRVYSLASAGTITACLLLLGIFYFVIANFNYAMESAESLVGFTVFFDGCHPKCGIKIRLFPQDTAKFIVTEGNPLGDDHLRGKLMGGNGGNFFDVRFAKSD